MFKSPLFIPPAPMKKVSISLKPFNFFKKSIPNFDAGKILTIL